MPCRLSNLESINMQININLSGMEDAQRRLASLSGPQMVSAIAAAINKTTAKGQAELTRAINQRYNIKADDVRNSVTLRKANASQDHVQATIQIFGSAKKQGRSLNMIHFMERKVTMSQGRKRRADSTLNQLRFNIIKGAGLKKILGDSTLKNGAFVGNQGRTIFQRTGRARLPIVPVQVIGVSQMFMFNPIHTRVINKIESEFNIELTRAIGVKLRGNL